MSHIDVDAVVIGSGAGGLTAAVALAQSGMKVLVCEQHYVAGGWTHTFTLQGYRFSPGVHYIGGLQPGGMMRRIYQGLGLSGDMAFCELNPDGFDHVYVGDGHDNLERFDIPKGMEAYKDRLKARFPDEASGIDRFFDTVVRANRQISAVQNIRTPLDILTLPLKLPAAVRSLLRSAGAMADAHLSDPLLKTIVLSQAGDHGMPPSMTPAIVQSMIMEHYFEGGYYPLGGAFTIPRAYVRALRRAGGEIRLSTPVEKILLEDGRAVGVRLESGEEIRARYVISNADPEVTLGKLVGRDHLSRRTRRKLDNVTYSTSALSLFFAVDMDLRQAGLDSGNVWFYRTPDIEDHYQRGLTGDVVTTDRPIDSLFLTTTTLKDPSKMHSGHHTCEAFTFTSYEPFRRWAGGHRSEDGPPKSADYLALKESLTDRMFNTLEEIVPGISRHVVFAELGTPLTNRHYINATAGNIYGIDKRWSQIGPFAFPVRSEIDGLYMVGASTTTGHGVAGVTMSGLMAASQILQRGFTGILNQRGPDIPIYPSDDISHWPDALREKIARRDQKWADDHDAELQEITAP